MSSGDRVHSAREALVRAIGEYADAREAMVMARPDYLRRAIELMTIANVKMLQALDAFEQAAREAGNG